MSSVRSGSDAFDKELLEADVRPFKHYIFSTFFVDVINVFISGVGRIGSFQSLWYKARRLTAPTLHCRSARHPTTASNLAHFRIDVFRPTRDKAKRINSNNVVVSSRLKYNRNYLLVLRIWHICKRKKKKDFKKNISNVLFINRQWIKYPRYSADFIF